MTVELTTIVSGYQDVLKGVARGDRPQPQSVVNALLQVEKIAKQQRLSYPLETLLGEWQLCFSTGTRKLKQRGGIVLGRGFYLPRFVSATIGFRICDSNLLEITNQIQLGRLSFKLTGPVRYLDKKNLLAFDFTQMQISGFDRAFYTGRFRAGKPKSEPFADQPIAQLPFFAFFLITDDLIAARGRGGGLAIWVRGQA